MKFHGNVRIESAGEDVISNPSSESSQSASDLAGGKSLANRFEKETAQTYQVRARLEDVSDLLSDLIKLSVVIRKAGLQSRSLRAASYVPRDEDDRERLEQFEKSFLPQVLEHRHELKDRLLRERLCRAISRRRRYFEYHTTHQQRIAFGGDPVEEQQPTQLLQLPVAAEQDTSPAITSPDISLRRNPRAHVRSLPPTKASDYDPHAIKEFSQTSSIPRSMVSSNRFARTSGIPGPPKVFGSGKHFECPYCPILISRKKLSKSLWR